MVAYAELMRYKKAMNPVRNRGRTKSDIMKKVAINSISEWERNSNLSASYF